MVCWRVFLHAQEKLTCFCIPLRSFCFLCGVNAKKKVRLFNFFPFVCAHLLVEEREHQTNYGSTVEATTNQSFFFSTHAPVGQQDDGTTGRRFLPLPSFHSPPSPSPKSQLHNKGRTYRLTKCEICIGQRIHVDMHCTSIHRSVV